MLRYPLLVFLLFAALIAGCSGDDPCEIMGPVPGWNLTDVDISVYTQTNMEKLRGLTELEGSLTISNDATDPVVDLSPLASLRAVSGQLTIRFTDLATLAPLENLSRVGSLDINSNRLLTSLTGLAGID